MNYIQKREGYSAIKALAAVNNAIIQLHGLWCAITEQRLNFSTETGGKSEITTY